MAIPPLAGWCWAGKGPAKLSREDFRAEGEIKQPWFAENKEHFGGAELITPSSLETKDLYNHSSLLTFSPAPSSVFSLTGNQDLCPEHKYKMEERIGHGG